MPHLPPVRAYHLILTTYGFWLPNDPRGSWSQFVRAFELRQFGLATKTEDRRSVAKVPHNRQRRLEAKSYLSHKPVAFNGVQAHAVAMGFAKYIKKSGCVVHACTVMPRHAHLVMGRHEYGVEMMANLLKGSATTQLNREGLHPFGDQPYEDGTLPSPWTRKHWKCYLSSDEQIWRAIRYVENNPIKEGLRRQYWSFVTKFGG